MDYEILEGFDTMDFPRVHAWLTTSYWSPGTSLERVTKSARHSSLLVGAFLGGEQVGYTRIVSDETTFAWICDVFVDERHRGQGLAKAMVRYAQEHRDHQSLR